MISHIASKTDLVQMFCLMLIAKFQMQRNGFPLIPIQRHFYCRDRALDLQLINQIQKEWRRGVDTLIYPSSWGLELINMSLIQPSGRWN